MLRKSPAAAGPSPPSAWGLRPRSASSPSLPCCAGVACSTGSTNQVTGARSTSGMTSTMAAYYSDRGAHAVRGADARAAAGEAADVAERAESPRCRPARARRTRARPCSPRATRASRSTTHLEPRQPGPRRVAAHRSRGTSSCAGTRASPSSTTRRPAPNWGYDLSVPRPGDVARRGDHHQRRHAGDRDQARVGREPAASPQTTAAEADGDGVATPATGIRHQRLRSDRDGEQHLQPAEPIERRRSALHAVDSAGHRRPHGLRPRPAHEESANVAVEITINVQDLNGNRFVAGRLHPGADRDAADDALAARRRLLGVHSRGEAPAARPPRARSLATALRPPVVWRTMRRR